MLDRCREFLDAHRGLLVGLGVFSAVSFVLGVLAGPLVAAWLPADHFVRPTPPRRGERRARRVGRLCVRILRNLLGILLVLVGIALLFLPGQGILTILLGLMVSDFPGKRRLEVALLSRPAVRRAVDALRARLGRTPLELPERTPSPRARVTSGRGSRPEGRGPTEGSTGRR